MKTTVLIILLAASVIASSEASAQATVSVGVSVPIPTVRFEVAPPLVVVSPGIQVVPDYDDEIFFVNGYYWMRSGPGWVRARDYRGGWVVVAPAIVPVTLVKIPHGKYKRWKHHPGGGAVFVPAGGKGKHHGGGHGKGHGKGKH